MADIWLKAKFRLREPAFLLKISKKAFVRLLKREKQNSRENKNLLIWNCQRASHFYEVLFVVMYSE